VSSGVTNHLITPQSNDWTGLLAASTASILYSSVAIGSTPR
jgi:hypothetical protein